MQKFRQFVCKIKIFYGIFSLIGSMSFYGIKGPDTEAFSFQDYSEHRLQALKFKFHSILCMESIC